MESDISVNKEKRRMLGQAMIKFMRADIKAQEFRNATVECHDKLDPTLLEIAYKCIGDGQLICDHYITVIKEDWHYWVQMLTYLQSDRNLQIFRQHNPKSQTAKYLTVAIVGVILPLGLSVLQCIRVPELFPLLFISLMFSILLSMLIAKLFNRRGNYKPDTELPYYWPYDSKEDFEVDHEKYVKNNPAIDIPMTPPDLTGKVAKVTNLLWESPRPDE